MCDDNVRVVDAVGIANEQLEGTMFITSYLFLLSVEYSVEKSECRFFQAG